MSKMDVVIEYMEKLIREGYIKREELKEVIEKLDAGEVIRDIYAKKGDEEEAKKYIEIHEKLGAIIKVKEKGSVKYRFTEDGFIALLLSLFGIYEKRYLVDKILEGWIVMTGDVDAITEILIKAALEDKDSKEHFSIATWRSILLLVLMKRCEETRKVLGFIPPEEFQRVVWIDFIVRGAAVAHGCQKEDLRDFADEFASAISARLVVRMSEELRKDKAEKEGASEYIL